MKPQTFLVGSTQIDTEGIHRYLHATGQERFFLELTEYQKDHECDADYLLVSFYAKMCYKSLVVGKNANIKSVRGIDANLGTCFDSGHGSVFEHVWLNWVTTGCSRVFTHELVRHRVGTAFSQTSGRYVSVEDANLVHGDDWPEEMAQEADYLVARAKAFAAKWRDNLELDEKPMAERKHWTSQIRRVMPVGADNEIGWSCNVRALRHMIEMRTSRHAEWEIRYVFNEVAEIVARRWPILLYGHEGTQFDGLWEYTNLRV